MGIITIDVRGSFDDSPNNKTFTAQEGGHAMAIHLAINYLNKQLPAAIQLDHKLESAGQHPGQAPFGKTNAKT